jgi:hypothetical protein
VIHRWGKCRGRNLTVREGAVLPIFTGTLPDGGREIFADSGMCEIRPHLGRTHLARMILSW